MANLTTALSQVRLVSKAMMLVSLVFLLSCRPDEPVEPVLKSTVNAVVNPSEITVGDSAKISWTSTSTTKIAMDGEDVSCPSGFIWVKPDITTTYTFVSSNENSEQTGYGSDEVTVKVNEGTIPTVELTVEPTSGEYGWPILYNDFARVWIKTTGMIDSVLVNGFNYNATGFDVKVQKDTLFVAEAYGSGTIVATSSVVVPVTQLGPNTFILTQNHFKGNAVLSRKEGETTWDTATMEPIWYTWTYYFSTHGEVLIYATPDLSRPLNWKKIGDDNWRIFFEDNQFYLELGEIYKIIELTPDILIIEDQNDPIRIVYSGTPNNGNEPNWDTGDPPWPYIRVY